jgi:hypothetical protein
VGEEWCHTFEYRWAESAGRADATLLVTRTGVVVTAEQVGAAASLTTKLVELVP